jgi:nucleotide-binding universal stress UspA family protein
VSGTGSAGRARVITGVSGSPGSLRALRYAAEVAGRHGAVLLPVLAWTPPGGELADRRFPSPYLRQIVVGAGQRGPARRWLGGRVARFCLARAACPVIAVPPADLAAAARGLRGWARRHRALTAEAAGLPAGTS